MQLNDSKRRVFSVTGRDSFSFLRTLFHKGAGELSHIQKQMHIYSQAKMENVCGALHCVLQDSVISDSMLNCVYI